jgi:hypothetical protein
MSILDRYASAIRSSNLRSHPDTTQSDTDILGAIGLASKRHPLATALARLFMGDNHASEQLVELLADMAWGKAAALNIKLRRVQAESMAQAVLAWHREGRCKACGGHGFALVHGAPVVGTTACRACHGTGRIPFDARFRDADDLRVARWLVSEVEREQNAAGPAAMAKLADRMP